MKSELITDFARLQQIVPEWAQLVEQVSDATPFQHPVWLLTWWRHFGNGSLHVLTFRKTDQLIAVVPLFLHQWEERRQLTLIGSGISDYLDPVIQSGYDVSVTRCLHDHLVSNPDWDVCNWQDLSAVTILQRLPQARAVEALPCMALSLDKSWDQILTGFSKDLKRNVRRYTQRAQQQGKLEFEAIANAENGHLSELMRLHTLRWEKHGEPGMIAANGSEAFLRDVVAKLSALGFIRFFVVRFRGKISALLLGFSYHRKLFAYMTAFDPEYDSLGFGRTLLFEAIRQAQEDGHSWWDFLRGDEPFKLSWGARVQPRCRVLIERKS